MPRGRMVVREPASGVALAQCLLARMFPKMMLDVPVNAFHDGPCKYCEWTDAEVSEALKDFNEWAGLKDGKYPIAVESFLTLPGDEQRRLVAKQRAP